MKKQASKTELIHKNYKIIKMFDYWGNWEYVLLKNNIFVERNNNFNVLKIIAYSN